MHQTDLFSDSHDRMLANDVVAAIERAEPAAALQAVAVLQAAYPDDRHLAPGRLLIATLELESANDGKLCFAPTTGLRQAVAHANGALTTAATQLLGADSARSFMAARWQALARRARTLGFDPADPELHAAPLWLSAGNWAQAVAAVEGIESWWHKPAPLAWMAQSRWLLDGTDAAWPLLAELVWLSPQRLQALLPALPERPFRRLAAGFEAAFDSAADWVWWPAWLLVEQPSLAKPLQACRADQDTAPQRAFNQLQSLLRLERAGRHHELVQSRRTLRELNPALFALYMATR